MRKFWLVPLLILLFLSSSIQVANASQGAKTPIQHVVFIMKENQSFDDYFETYPAGPGNALANNSVVQELSVPYVAPVDTKVPNYPGLGWLFGYTTLTYEDTSTQANPGEGWVDYHGDWNYGLLTGWVAYSGPQSMAYVSHAQIPYYWDYAEEYVLFDNWFSPVMTETLPNRLSSLAGVTPVTNDLAPPPYVPLSQTIFYQLTNHNVSWSYFELFSTASSPPSSEIYPLDSISGFSSDSTMMSRVMNMSVFYQEAADGTLPAVSFVEPFGLYGENGIPDVSEHPPANITVGEQWTVNAVNAVMHGPDWGSSTIFITWDENGGFFDNVAAPQVNSFGYGARVPTLMISPYAKENFIDDQVLNHMSVLAFIDYNWGLPYLSSWVANSGVPLNAFDFGQQPRAPIILGQGGPYPPDTYPIPLQIPPSELNYSSPAYVSPSSVYHYAIPPLWLASAQFFLIVFAVIAIGVSYALKSRSTSPAIRTSGLAGALVLAGAAFVFGLVYPAIPPPPAPPWQPTTSTFTVLAIFVVAISLVALSLSLARRYLRRRMPNHLKPAVALALAVSVAALIVYSVATPGIVFPSGAGNSDWDLAPPQTVLGLILSAISPLTTVSFLVVIAGAIGLASQVIVRALRSTTKAIVRLRTPMESDRRKQRPM